MAGSATLQYVSGLSASETALASLPALATPHSRTTGSARPQIGHHAVGFDLRSDREGAREEPDCSAAQQPSGAGCRGQPGHAGNPRQKI
jgi:hypothetical protein